MNNRFLIIVLILLNSCSSCKTVQNSDSKFYTITEKYGIDLISSKELAANIAELIWIENNPNDNIQLYKPFEVELIENGRVWQITGHSPDKRNVLKRTYHMKINKNTGEILRDWVEK